MEAESKKTAPPVFGGTDLLERFGGDAPALRREARCELARRDFWWYCHVKAPGFYARDRAFLKTLCRTLQDFYDSDRRVLIVNMPPRHGKSRTVGCFVEWVLGRDPSRKIMTGSYNESLSTVFSRGVRNTIQEIRGDRDKIVYADIFPGVSVKKGEGAANLWSLTGGYNSYLATSPDGTATGFGADLLILDDLIRSAAEACSEEVLQKHWDWFTNTMLSRLEEGGKVIIVMTRWHSGDLAGRAGRHYGGRAQLLCMPAMGTDGKMLCPAILSEDSYREKLRLMGPEIAAANYQQQPIDLRGALYTGFQTYRELPPEFMQVRCYADTADTGADFLCAIDYGVFEGEAYVLSVLYTAAPMEVTEPALAEMLHRDGVHAADIESNNGGRGFARNVERLLRERFGNRQCVLRPFFQHRNKKSRILSNSTWVMAHVRFPEDWAQRWPAYYDAMRRYQRAGKNAHDDAPDATTGIAEVLARGNVYSFE